MRTLILLITSSLLRRRLGAPAQRVRLVQTVTSIRQTARRVRDSHDTSHVVQTYMRSATQNAA
jgi:hypothetical protein